MLQALLADLKALDGLKIRVCLDSRCLDTFSAAELEIVPVQAGVDILTQLPALMADCDAVWPIAPESNGVLAKIAEMIVAQQKIPLLSSPQAVALCADKLAVFQLLKVHAIPVVETALADQAQFISFPCVIKPRDGLGCEGTQVLENSVQLTQAMTEWVNPAQAILQPFCAGQAISLSALFRYGQAWLLCVNQQQMQLQNRQFHLQACLVNIPNIYTEYFQGLITRIAGLIPGLWGYIGIDLMDTTAGPLLLEINPRLTSSYAGIHNALGINPAEQVLRLLKAEPVWEQQCNQSIRIEMD